jgi:hypothetical protein
MSEKEKRVLICGAAANFPDDLRGVCDCGKRIVFRPHLAHIAIKVCLSCGAKMIKRDQGARIEITEKVMQEVTEAINARNN